MSAKVTKSAIVKALRTQNTTEIFKIAKKAGVNVLKKGDVFKFIQEYAPSDKVYRNAYSLSYGSAFFKEQRARSTSINMPVSKAIQFAKQEKKEGTTNYSKILVIGNSNIYWASPVYKHKDYNKSIAFENTEKNRNVAAVINRFLGYELN